MNTFGRAIRYLLRKKLRSIMLLLLLTVLAASMLICLTIRNRADTAAQEISSSFGASFSIEIDTSKLEYKEVKLSNGDTFFQTEGHSIHPEKVEEMLAIDGVTGCRTKDYFNGAYVNIDLIPGFYHYLSNNENADPMSDPHDNEITSHYTAIYCVGNSKWHEFFDMGAFELIEGRHINSDDNDENHLVALISETVAKKNGLTIGDTFTCVCCPTMSTDSPNKVPDDPFKFEIVGIYKTVFQDEISNYTSEVDIAENAIYSGFVTDRIIWTRIAEALGHTYDPDKSGLTRLTLYVESPDMLDTIMKKVKASDIAEWKYYKMYKDDTEYEVMVRPLRSMITLTTVLLVIFMGGGFLILAMLMAMWTKSRRWEMGIYLSIGLRKRNIVAQLVGEIALITLIAILLAVFIVLPISDYIGDRLADSMVDDTAKELYQVQRDISKSYITIQRVSSDPVVLDYAITALEVLVQSIGVMAVAVISALLSARSILRLKPKDILSNMS